MAVDISREQQKMFIEHFMAQVLDVSLDLVAQEDHKAGPGETIHAVGVAVIRQLRGMVAEGDLMAPRGDYDA